MNVLILSPGYPAEMPLFTRGIKLAGANAIGIGDQPEAALVPMARDNLAAYFQVGSLWNEEHLVDEVLGIAQRIAIDRVECLWEPGMIVAAKLREALKIPGMTVAETIPFRDKEAMKLALDKAGIRTPRHVRATTAEEVRDAALHIGYPLIVKPIAGAGSADTYRVNSVQELELVLPRLHHVEEVSVEEFIDGEEYTFDTICAGGRILFWNICYYRPRPLIGRSLEWVSPQTLALRDIEAPHLEPGRKMGRAVLEALDFKSGFTHMEWYLKANGEAVFGEIAARPPGARTVDIMNYACDADFFTGWAEAVCNGRLNQPTHRKYNVAIIAKRARGQGRIQRIEGLERLLAELGPAVVAVDLLPVGSPRRDWIQTLLSDGWVIVRHADLETCMAMADRVGTDLQIYAG